MVLSFLIHQKIPHDIAISITVCIYLLLLALLSFAANYVAKRILLKLIHKFVEHSKNDWDDALVKRRVFHRFSHVAPAIVIYLLAPQFFIDFVVHDPYVQIIMILQKASYVYLLLVGLLILNSLCNAVLDIYYKYEISRKVPIRGLTQIIKIVVSILTGIAIVAVVIDKEIWPLLTGMGAFTAVLMLVFKDSILGLVAGVQLSSNNMIHIGDWIEMPKYGADGDVIDITLTTVKVQNFDKTITTVPAYALISDSFKNWRGMSESGGRRIKRSINIDTASIKFCDEKMLERFKRYHYIRDYIRIKETEIAKWNDEQGIDSSELVNGRRMTNIGIFRAYITEYLRNNSNLNKFMTMMVRQLPPTSQGLPLEIYTYSSDKRWVNYEGIQADIFDHILAVIPQFELSVYQQPSGADLVELKKQI